MVFRSSLTSFHFLLSLLFQYLSKKEYYSDYFDEDVGGPSRDSIWNNQQDFDAALTQVMHPKGKVIVSHGNGKKKYCET